MTRQPVSFIELNDLKPIDLNRNVVFILGAGASKPYGLPLGTELKDIMKSNLSNNTCRQAISDYKFNQSLIDEFIYTLPKTRHPTIDIFLEQKRKFRDIGAFLIAYSLLPLENDNNLFPQRDWYSHLYNVIGFERDEQTSKNIVFVSLNYDRSLEHFLHKAYLIDAPDDLEQFAEPKLDGLKFIHPHGSFGEYPKIPYGARDVDAIQAAAKSILIVSDSLESSKSFLEARQAIDSASNIIIIGFGYDRTTLHRLFKNVDLSEKRILGTVHKLDNPIIDFLYNEFFNGKIELPRPAINADAFIRQVLPC